MLGRPLSLLIERYSPCHVVNMVAQATECIVLKVIKVYIQILCYFSVSPKIFFGCL